MTLHSGPKKNADLHHQVPIGLDLSYEGNIVLFFTSEYYLNFEFLWMYIVTIYVDVNTESVIVLIHDVYAHILWKSYVFSEFEKKSVFKYSDFVWYF